MWVHRFPSLSKMFINIVLREAKNKTRARSSAGQIHWFSKLLRVYLKKVHPKALLRQSTLSPLSDKIPLLPCGELLFIIWLCTWLCDDKGAAYIKFHYSSEWMRKRLESLEIMLVEGSLKGLMNYTYQFETRIQPCDQRRNCLAF